jgi:hypothetical protein
MLSRDQRNNEIRTIFFITNHNRLEAAFEDLETANKYFDNYFDQNNQRYLFAKKFVPVDSDTVYFIETADGRLDNNCLQIDYAVISKNESWKNPRNNTVRSKIKINDTSYYHGQKAV